MKVSNVESHVTWLLSVLSEMTVAKKRKRGRKSFRSQAKLPRRAGLKTKLQYKSNQMYSRSAMQAFRAGFRVWWACCPDYLKQIKLGEPGSYEPTNQHGGVMFALGREVKLSEGNAPRFL